MKHNKIAIVNQWPDIPNAERENLARLKVCAEHLGVKVYTIDKYGKNLETGELIGNNDVDFVINMHFEVPKAYDAFSYVTLWNPVMFYFMWDYTTTSHHMATHDDFLSADSQFVDDHLKRTIYWNKRQLPPEMVLHHTLFKPVIPPVLGGDKKIFYCGINWDKITSKKTRHSGVLKVLDGQNAINIYGPEKLNGVSIWDDFHNYISSIPFDGVSVVSEIAKCGIGLVFSSDAHNICGLMSNRLYECLAAGAVIICDANPFARKYFSDCFLFVDTNQPDDLVAKDILAYYKWIQDNPTAAYALAVKAQSIFKEKFSLELELGLLFESHEDRKHALEKLSHSLTDKYHVKYVFVDLDPTIDSLERAFNNIEKQTYQNVSLYFVFDRKDLSKTTELLSICRKNSHTKFETQYLDIFGRANERLLSVGLILDMISNECQDNDLICISVDNSYLYSNHFTTLVRLFEDDHDLQVGCSDMLYKYIATNNSDDFRLNLETVRKPSSILERVHKPCFSAVLMKPSALKSGQEIFYRYLDEALTYFLAIANNEHLDFTGKATITKVIENDSIFNKGLFTVEEQMQILDDIFPRSTGRINSSSVVQCILDADAVNKRRLSIDVIKNIPISSKLKKIMSFFYKRVFKANS